METVKKPIMNFTVKGFHITRLELQNPPGWLLECWAVDYNRLHLGYIRKVRINQLGRVKFWVFEGHKRVGFRTIPVQKVDNTRTGIVLQLARMRGYDV